MQNRKTFTLKKNLHSYFTTSGICHNSKFTSHYQSSWSSAITNGNTLRNIILWVQHNIYTRLTQTRINTVDTGVTSDIRKAIRRLKYTELNVLGSSQIPNLVNAWSEKSEEFINYHVINIITTPIKATYFHLKHKHLEYIKVIVYTGYNDIICYNALIFN